MLRSELTKLSEGLYLYGQNVNNKVGFTTMFVVQRQMVFQKSISGGDYGREFYFSLGRRLSIFLFHR